MPEASPPSEPPAPPPLAAEWPEAAPRLDPGPKFDPGRPEAGFSSAPAPLKSKAAGSRSLKRSTFHGAAWTVGERVISQGIRLLSNLVLSRLLFPGAFGVAATVNVFQSALTLLSDIGTGQSIIQHKRGGTPRFLNTAWTLQIIRGVILSIVAAALSGPMSTWFFGKPQLTPMLAVTSLTLLIQGFRSPRDMLAMKNMALAPLAARNLMSQVIGFSTMIGLALFWRRDPWALVIGGVVTTTARMILSFVALPGPPARLCWDREVLREISKFGRWIFASTLLMFLASQGDRFLMSRFLDFRTFGLYNIAFLLCAIPAQSIQMLGLRVIFPAFSKVVGRDPARLPDAYNRLVRVHYLTLLPCIGMLIGMGPLIVKILYDPRYIGAGWMVQLLAIRAATDSLVAPSISALMALGKPRFSAMTRGLQAATILAGIPFAYRAFGTPGAVTLVALSGIGTVVMAQVSLRAHGLFRPSRELLGLLAIAAGAALGWGLDRAISPWVS